MAKLIYGNRIGKEAGLLVGSTAQICDSTGKKILLTKREDNSRWCLPGGQLESGESVTEACAREVLEETGLAVEVGRLIAVYTSPDMLLYYDEDHQYQVISFHFMAAVIGGALVISDETTAVGFFSEQEIKKMDVMEHHLQRIEDGLLGKKETIIR